MNEEITKMSLLITHLDVSTETKEKLYTQNYKIATEIERLNYKIKSIVYMCYESDMPYDEFKQVWVNAFGRIYDPNDVEILKKELKGSDKDE